MLKVLTQQNFGSTVTDCFCCFEIWLLLKLKSHLVANCVEDLLVQKFLLKFKENIMMLKALYFRIALFLEMSLKAKFFRLKLTNIINFY